MPDRYDKVEDQLDKLTALILYTGPMTAYQACIQLQPGTFAKKRRTQKFLTPHNPPPSTVQTHFDILEEENELMIYDHIEFGRRQKYYGFTPYGFLTALDNPYVKAKDDFKKITKIWLAQKKFRFFLPKEEVLSKLDTQGVEKSLANICMMTSAAFPIAQDVAEYLEELGYGEFGPSQIVDFAANIASSAFPKEFLEWSKVLAHHFPVYREHIKQFIKTREQWLAKMRKELIEEQSR